MTALIERTSAALANLNQLFIDGAWRSSSADARIDVVDCATEEPLANDTIYGLNAAVFTDDTDRALSVARELRSGTVGHNSWRSDPKVSFGGFKQSGVGREGGTDGLEIYLEKKYVVLDDVPTGHAPQD